MLQMALDTQSSCFLILLLCFKDVQRILNVHKLYCLILIRKLELSFLRTPNYCCQIDKPERKHIFLYSASVFIIFGGAFCQYTHSVFITPRTLLQIILWNALHHCGHVIKWPNRRYFEGKMFLWKIWNVLRVHRTITLYVLQHCHLIYTKNRFADCVVWGRVATLWAHKIHLSDEALVFLRALYLEGSKNWRCNFWFVTCCGGSLC